ncbi:MAG: CAP domain-containing protein, partial [Candidatus Moranbacteria bacterium]|nr:CAP domain-containing protein [Candidatus Moranbacteria bacterium]
IIYASLSALAAAVFYYKPYLEDFYSLSKEKVASFESVLSDSVSKPAGKNIYAPTPLKSEEKSTNTTLTRKGVIEFTNKERSKDGKKTLKENKELDAAALKKAKDILAKQYFEHVSPDGNGPDYFVSSAGYDYITIGENLALGNFSDDQDLVTAWMASEGHRENILNSKFQEIGVAVVKGTYEGKSTWVGVQEFGTPADVCEAADEDLKEKIESNSKKIDKLEDNLKENKSKIEDMSPRDDDYSQAVDDYNTLVNEYNALVKKTKDLIEEYNDEVKDYNKCIESY